LVRLIQLVDDLLDWRDDWACRRPTYVTAFLREWTGSSRDVMTQVCRHANRFRRSLRSASDRQAEALPLKIAGGAVWLTAIILTRIRFSE
jgi:hypothetical protein